MPENAFSLPSFAKINLGLRVIGRRLDGYHDIFTVFQTVSLHDTLTFHLSDKLEVTCSDPSLPCDYRNSIIQAAQKLRAYALTRLKSGESGSARCELLGAKIHLEKLIPSPGGLAGGSSNAAVALIGLSRLWKLTIREHELFQTAAELGSDVPFFLYGGTASGLGRGTIIEKLADFDTSNIVIVTPDISVSTPCAFESLNAASLTTTEANRILGVCRFEAESRDSYLKGIRNDFENTVFAAHPEVGEVKQVLLELGASTALLSGSGASVFGIFDTKETRQAAIKALDIYVNWRKFAVATISRNEYREALEIAF